MQIFESVNIGGMLLNSGILRIRPINCKVTVGNVSKAGGALP